ncbi:MAG TPA: tetratricopeptide repeat protein [Verrucomicrobiae bacterium]|nr:tetratricopeptide repeat protein [Verrucomicrobiae bacterium]
MNPLPWPDNHHLDAAEGWLELDVPVEAADEIQQIAPELRLHPEVLNVRWQILARKKDWRNGLVIAGVISRLVPESPVGWIHLSYTLHEMGRTREAWENLSRVAPQFPGDCTIAYNRACYACRLGNLETARDLLRRAMQLGDEGQVKETALSDHDLEPLWRAIREL